MPARNVTHRARHSSRGEVLIERRIYKIKGVNLRNLNPTLRTRGKSPAINSRNNFGWNNVR